MPYNNLIGNWGLLSKIFGGMYGFQTSAIINMRIGSFLVINARQEFLIKTRYAVKYYRKRTALYRDIK